MGGWFKCPHDITADLPHSEARPWSVVEARLSFIMDRDKGQALPVRSYSRIWGWGRTKTANYMRKWTEQQEFILDVPEASQKRARSEPGKPSNGAGYSDQASQKRATDEPEASHNYKTKTKKKKKNTVKLTEYTPGFLRFWGVYPRKIKKAEAFKVWTRDGLEDLEERIIDVVEQYLESSQWTENEGRFIPHPSTFLNQRRYEDEIAPPEPRDHYQGKFVPIQGGRKPNA